MTAADSQSVGATRVALRDVVGHCGDDGYGQPTYGRGGMERNSRTMALPTLTVAQREEALRKAQGR